MKILLSLILIIAIFYIHRNINKKIDADEKKAMETPGTASYIRDKFPEIINCISSTPCIEKEFERDGYIRFLNSNTKNKIVLQQWSGKLNIVLTNDQRVLNKWEVGVKDIDSLLLSEIKRSIGTCSYWGNYKMQNPKKAQAILELTHINMDKESDVAAREIVESLERWSSNKRLPISKLKKHFIESFISEFGGGIDFEADEIMFFIENTKIQMEKEADFYGIDKKHTICRFMIDAFEEYIQSKTR